MAGNGGDNYDDNSNEVDVDDDEESNGMALWQFWLLWLSLVLKLCRPNGFGTFLTLFKSTSIFN